MGIGFLVLVVVVSAGFMALGWWSGRAAYEPPGLVDGHLAECGPAPNCVCSEAAENADAGHAIDALALQVDSADEVWSVLTGAIKAAGGRVVTQSNGYLHATFTSRIFRFVDDVEFRLADDRLHWRSASRVGYSDLGANRARIENLRVLILTALAPGSP